MANEYMTSTELKDALELTGETFADAQIALALTAASRAINGACRRRFYKDTQAAVRYYTPQSSRRALIDDLVDLTEVAVGPGDNTFSTVLTENDDFVLEPLNADADGRPATSILSETRALYCYTRSLRVTGKFGWPAVPEEVKQATGILATKLVKRLREAPFGIVGFGMEGGYARLARNDPDVMMLIGDYERRAQMVA